MDVNRTANRLATLPGRKYELKAYKMTLPPLKRVALAKISPILDGWLHPNLFESVDRFCMFIGHGRSGSTLVGALLNAHQNVVISNEIDVLSYLGLAKNRRELFGLLYRMSRRQARRGSPGGGGYHYAVPNQWQGRARVIRVIGDRRAGSTAIQLFRNPGLLEQFQEIVEVPIIMISVLRNPYDTIATTFQKTSRRPDEPPESHIQRQVTHYFERCKGIMNAQDIIGPDNVKFVYHEELVARPEAVLSDLCGILNIEASKSYLSNCSQTIRATPRKTRHTIDWSSATVEMIEQRIQKISWLSGYHF